MNQDTLFTTNNLTIAINDPKSRSALTLAFGSGLTGLVHTEILIYLVFRYFNQVKNNYSTLKTHDDYVLVTISDIKLATRQSELEVRTVVSHLEDMKLISRIHRKGLITSIRVELENVQSFLDTALTDAKANDEPILEKKKQSIQNRKERRKKITANGLDFNLINQITRDEDTDKISTISSDQDTQLLIFLFNHYYKEYTGCIYSWSPVRFNTLMQNWRNRSSYQEAEFSLSLAIFKALYRDNNNDLFESKVRYNFCPEPFNPDKFKKEISEGLLYDNLLNRGSDCIQNIKETKDNNSSSFEQLKKSLPKQIVWFIRDPEGNMYKADNLKQFCREHFGSEYLSYTSNLTARGKHKGWTARKI